MLLTGVAVSIARCGREKEINAQVMAMKEEQTRQELRMQQEYGCDIYGQYEYPYNTMSQDWSGDQVEGFYYHEASACGTLPETAEHLSDSCRSQRNGSRSA